MSAGDSIVSICNIGLISSLGADPIASLDDNRKASILCKARYDQVRRAVLRAHPWSFAKAEALLPAAAAQPITGSQTAFTLPADFIRVADLPDRQNGTLKYQIFGRTIRMEGTAPLPFVYIYDCQDPSLFDPLFVEVLGYAVAAEIAEPLTQSVAKKNSALSNLEGKLSIARTVTAQDGSEDEWDVDVLLRSRV